VEPNNQVLIEHQAQCAQRRAAGQPTLPSTVALERQINPFLRCEQPAVVAAAQLHGATGTTPVEVLAALRSWKNTFQ
jgi:hydroxyacylglutathione hydrolase